MTPELRPVWWAATRCSLSSTVTPYPRAGQLVRGRQPDDAGADHDDVLGAHRRSPGCGPRCPGALMRESLSSTAVSALPFVIPLTKVRRMSSTDRDRPPVQPRLDPAGGRARRVVPRVRPAAGPVAAALRDREYAGRCGGPRAAGPARAGQRLPQPAAAAPGGRGPGHHRRRPRRRPAPGGPADRVRPDVVGRARAALGRAGPGPGGAADRPAARAPRGGARHRGAAGPGRHHRPLPRRRRRTGGARGHRGVLRRDRRAASTSASTPPT